MEISQVLVIIASYHSYGDSPSSLELPQSAFRSEPQYTKLLNLAVLSN